MQKWNEAISLVGPHMTTAVLDREIDDSRRLLKELDGPSIVDFGSGNGLPAIPLAIERPDWSFTLVEADRRKAAFLNAVRRALGLINVTVLTDRIERLVPLDAREITARAFAPLDRLIALALPHLADDGRLVLSKGPAVSHEIENARKTFSFAYEITPHPQARGCTLTVANIGPRA